ncbi:MAG: phosphonoacetaldehyde hydrolase [Desulfobacterales bacterium]
MQSKIELRAVILDLAGTCVDYGSRAPVEALVELFRRRGVTVDFACAREPMGLGKREHIAALLARPEVADRWRAVHGGEPGAGDVEALYGEFVPLQIEVLTRSSRLIPGTVEAVEKLRAAGVRVGVTTGYNRAMMNVVLGEAARQGFHAEAAVCVEDVPAGRPAPWMIFRCLERLSVWPPAAAAAVGDTIPDVVAGRNAGCWSVGVAATGNLVGWSEEEASHLPAATRRTAIREARRALRQAGAHFVIDCVADLDPLCTRLARRLAAGRKP